MERNLTKGSMLQNILVFSLPFLLSNFLQTLYGMADLFIAGRYYGAEIITAISIGSQVMHMVTVMLVGIAMGTTVMIGQAVGADDKKAVSRTIGNTIVLFLTIAFGAMALLLVFTGPITQVLSTPAEAVSDTMTYLRICFIGIPLITAYNVISAVFRGLGDSKSPMIFVAIACVINIFLDILFMGPMHMGAAGAACGTVFAQTFSVVIALVAIKIKQTGIRVQKDDLIPSMERMKKILGVGVPICCQDGFIQISFIVVTIIANRRGLEMAAAVGIVEKIICFLFLVPSSMLSTISVIAAQNLGAEQEDRARLSLRYGLYIVMGYGFVCALIFQFAAAPVVALFTKDAAVAVYGAQYLRSYIVDCFFAGIHFCFSGYFCACEKSIVSFIHNVISVLCVRIPGAYYASVWFPATLYPMGFAPALGSMLSAIICIGVYMWFSRKRVR